MLLVGADLDHARSADGFLFAPHVRVSVNAFRFIELRPAHVGDLHSVDKGDVVMVHAAREQERAYERKKKFFHFEKLVRLAGLEPAKRVFSSLLIIAFLCAILLRVIPRLSS
jgi:hypothetical protein